jgi:hypothetical protein
MRATRPAVWNSSVSTSTQYAVRCKVGRAGAISQDAQISRNTPT